MIEIDSSNLDTEKFYKYIEKYIQKSDKYNLISINQAMNRLFGKDFKYIVIAKPDEIRECLSNASGSYENCIEELKDLYEVFRNKWVDEFVKDLDIKVCPFCNREYIFKFEDRIKGKTRVIASLDHYYDKSTYPFLSVSLFNLIPCCHICNSKFKHTKNFWKEKHLYPYEENFHEKAKFSHFFTTVDGTTKNKALLSKERISLNLTPLNKDDKATQNTIDTFRLETLYQEHKDIVLELIQKREIYPDSYIDELFTQYEGTLFKNREDVMRLITGGYIDDKDLDKRPLSKLIKDISEELELI